MYAVIETGGKQYKVTPGERIKVELLGKEAGEAVEFSKVLLVGGDGETLVGSPGVEGALVTGEVKGEAKGKKIVIFKHKRRKGYRKKTGHRQRYTEVLVREIRAGGKVEAWAPKAKDEKAAAAEAPAEAAAEETPAGEKEE